MSKSKKLYILIGVLLAVTVLTVAVSKHETRKEEIRTSGQTFLEIPNDSVTLLSWDCQGKALSFQKENGSWKYAADENSRSTLKKSPTCLRLFSTLQPLS